MKTLRVKRYTSFLSTTAGLDGKIMLKSEILMEKQGQKFSRWPRIKDLLKTMGT
jgi:hypothetical protein